MDFKSFMRKLDGDSNEKAFDHSAETTGALDVQSVIRIVRGFGYSLWGMEEGSDFPYGVLASFRDGMDGVAMGLYIDCPRNYYTSLRSIYYGGRRYAEQGGRNPQSSVQEGLPCPTSNPDGGTVGTSTIGDSRPHTDSDHALDAARTLREMGGETGDTFTREELVSNPFFSSAIPHLSAPGWVCSTFDPEEVGVSSVRNERESGERSSEDTCESS
tara:strand:- start:341 stop:985 length:645 start_codon:yes stop_codon:yes gene_type:complete